MIETKNYLGHGGFANVYLVKRKSDGARVAMKQSQRPMIAMRDEELKAFTREVDAMKRLDNPFIIKLYEAFEQSDYFFLATEYADGGSLDKLLEAQ
jgi:serine/threonine protein kinase